MYCVLLTIGQVYYKYIQYKYNTRAHTKLIPHRSVQLQLQLQLQSISSLVRARDYTPILRTWKPGYSPYPSSPSDSACLRFHSTVGPTRFRYFMPLFTLSVMMA